ncbi:hypothetical protein MTO96_009462 [Rhipicephalus appendiculatus]
MGCVNYKLYHSLNLHYPPKLENEPAEPTDVDDEDEVSERVASLNNKLKSVLTNVVADDAPQMDDFPEVEGESNADIKSEEEKQKKFLNLFSGLKVFLGREVPRESLTFVLRSFGAEVSWDESLFVGSTFPESDPTVTHQIVDRPEVKKRYMNRYYVQPQWVYDCVNYRKLLPEQDYFMGERLAMLRVQRGEEPAVSEEESMEEEGTAEDDGTAEEGKNSDDIPESEDEQDDESDGEDSGVDEEEESEDEEEESEDDEEEVKKSASRKQRTKEAKKRKQPDAEAEPAVEPKKPLIGVKAATVVREDPEKVAQRIKSEEKRLAVLMIPKKHKRLYDKIVFGQKRRAREAAALKQKREEIKKSSKKAKKK